MREQVISRIINYLEKAEDWDIFEVAEWTFGYDDPQIERFKEELKKKDLTDIIKG